MTYDPRESIHAVIVARRGRGTSLSDLRRYLQHLQCVTWKENNNMNQFIYQELVRLNAGCYDEPLYRITHTLQLDGKI